MILITGVAGFIGSNLAEYFIKSGKSVLGVDNFDNFYARSTKENNLKSLLGSPYFSFQEGDIRDAEFLNNIPANVELVVHLAAKTGIQPSLKIPHEYIDVNINGTLSVLEWMRQTNVRKLIFASSSSVYGNNIVPFSENDYLLNPLSPYAMTKRSSELLNYTYHHLHNIDVVNLRFFTVYGPRQRPDLAIHKFIRAIEQHKPISLYGAGDTSRDYTYIDDIVDGIAAATSYLATHEQVFETFNLGNSAPVSLTELIETIEGVIGKNAIKINLPEQPGDMKITYANIDKATHLLSYKPSTTLKQGISKFYQWYLEQSMANAV